MNLSLSPKACAVTWFLPNLRNDHHHIGHEAHRWLAQVPQQELLSRQQLVIHLSHPLFEVGLALVHWECLHRFSWCFVFYLLKRLLSNNSSEMALLPANLEEVSQHSSDDKNHKEQWKSVIVGHQKQPSLVANVPIWHWMSWDGRHQNVLGRELVNRDTCFGVSRGTKLPETNYIISIACDWISKSHFAFGWKRGANKIMHSKNMTSVCFRKVGQSAAMYGIDGNQYSNCLNKTSTTASNTPSGDCMSTPITKKGSGSKRYKHPTT